MQMGRGSQILSWPSEWGSMKRFVWPLVVSLLVGCGSTPTERPPDEAVLGDRWVRSLDGMVMVFVPGGQFDMGSTAGDIEDVLALCDVYYDDCAPDWFADETPVHPVQVNGFWMDQTEVTNAQFAIFLNAQSNQTEDGVTWLDEGHGQIEWAAGQYQSRVSYADRPAVEVSWYGAAAYCQWAGGRLPTEAEWAYAACGTSPATFPWGEEITGERLNVCDASCELDWADGAIDDGYVETAPVGSYPAGESWCGVMRRIISGRRRKARGSCWKCWWRRRGIIGCTWRGC